MTDPSAFHDVAAELREAFDRSFAEPVQPALPAGDDFLCVLVGDREYAVRRREITGVTGEWPCVPMPTTVPAFLGVTHRQDAVPVYCLRRLLGLTEIPVSRSLLLVDGPLGLAIDGISGRLPATEVTLQPLQTTETGLRHVQALATTTGKAYPVLDIPAIFAAVTRLAGSTGAR